MRSCLFYRTKYLPSDRQQAAKEGINKFSAKTGKAGTVYTPAINGGVSHFFITKNSIMKEKQIKLNHVTLFYRDNESSGLPVIFIHGNSLHDGLFYKQFEALSPYRIIAPDLPGHGQSAFSNDPAQDYGVGSYIRLLAEFIQSFKLGQCILFGHSLGGHLAIHLAGQLRNIAGLAIMGTPP